MRTLKTLFSAAEHFRADAKAEDHKVGIGGWDPSRNKPPIAAQMIKQSTNQIANALNHALMHMDADQNLLTTTTEDRKAAIKSYLEKTAPTYTGN